MRLFLILVAVLAVVFFAAMGLGGNHTRSGPTPSWAALLGTATAPFAPKITLAQRHFDVDAAHQPRAAVPRSTTSTRVAKFALVSGDAVRIRYACRAASGRQCPQTLCLYKGAPVAGCDEQSTKALDGSVVIYDDGGDLIFEALRGAAAVELR
jgi:hypothetical protein